MAKKGVTEAMPFDNKVLVFKVVNKMFALTNIEVFESVNLKCDPEKAIEYREQFNGVNPGYHMSKVHWNTISINSDVDSTLLIKMINDSYDLVVSKLTKKEKAQLLES